MNVPHLKFFICIIPIAIAFYCWTSVTQAKETHPKGVVIEEIEPNLADKEGLHPDDVILSWKRLSLLSSNHDRESGEINHIFDWMFLIEELVPRSPIQLKIKRNIQEIDIELASCNWEISVRPVLSVSEGKEYELGTRNIKQKQIEKGVKIFKQLAQAHEKRDNWVSACWFYLKAGHSFVSVQKWEKAQTFYNDALNLSMQHNIAVAQIIAWSVLGDNFRKLNNFEKADQAYKSARKMIVDTFGKQSLFYSNILNKLGTLAWKGGDLSGAKKYYSEANAVLKKNAPESIGMAGSLSNLGLIAEMQGDLFNADKYYHQALALFNDLKPDSLESAITLNNMGIVAWKRGNLAEAESYFIQALVIRKELRPESLAVAKCLNNLGIIAFERGDLAGADQYYKQALTINEKQENNSLSLAKSMNNLGNVAHKRGDFSGADDYYKKALSINKIMSPGSIDVALNLNNLGDVAQMRGDYEAAEDYFKQALAIFKRHAPGSLDVAKCFSNLGNVAIQRENLSDAEMYFKKSMAIETKIATDSLDIATNLNNLGLVALHRNDYFYAELYNKQSLSINKRLAPGSLDVATNYRNLGRIAYLKNEFKKSFDYNKKALAIREKLAPGSILDAETLHDLGLINVKQKKYKEALTFLHRAVDSLEKQRGTWGGGETGRELFAAQYADYYRDLIDILIQLELNDEAFNILEQYRARSFLVMLAERDLDFSRDAPSELIREQKVTNFEYDKVQRQLSEVIELGESKKVKSLLKRLRDLRKKQTEISERIKQISPRLASLQYPEPLDLERTRSIMPKDTLFLSYCVGKEKTHLFVLFNEKLTIYTIPVNRENLMVEIQWYTNHLSSPGMPIHRLVRASQRLYELLLQPAAREIGMAERLLICPDGPLHNLSFASLNVTPNKYFIEEKPLSYILSATVFSEITEDLRRNYPSIALVAFGDPIYSRDTGSEMLPRSFIPQSEFPQLPSTRKEIENISRLFGDNVHIFMGEQAKEEEVKKLSGSFDSIHFACHGILDNKFPLNSGLVLTLPNKDEKKCDNGILQVWELFEALRIDADLVTLSACYSGSGKEMGGEGLIGLTRAFQYAGARSVLSSLWSVADETTAVFMKHFYSYLFKGHSKPDALRMTQLDFIQSSEVVRKEIKTSDISIYHTFYWAGFMLNGAYP